MHNGSCLCGKVSFEVATELGQSDGCHCFQCRKWTGHFLASTEILRSSLSIHGDQHLSWFHSSEKVRRGFCKHCGSSLFFDPLDKVKHVWIGVALGAFELPTQTQLSKHIFVSEKGDYYEICDDLPQNKH